MLARAHVPDRAGLLAVAGQAGGGQRVERRALGAAGEQGLAHARPAVDRLERPDVEVLARMRAGHDRDLGRLEVERGDPAGLDEREQPERLDRRAEGDQPVRVAELADDPAVGVGLDDVAAMDALLDPVAQVAGEDRGDDPAARGRACRGSPRAWLGRGTGSGHDRWVSGSGRGRRTAWSREDTPTIATMGDARSPSSPGGPTDAMPTPDAARLAAPGRPPQARHPARRADRAQEVPRGRPRAVVAARLRGAGRRRASARSRSGRRSRR